MIHRLVAAYLATDFGSASREEMLSKNAAHS